MAHISRSKRLKLFAKCIAVGTILWVLPVIFDIYADTSFPYVPYAEINRELVTQYENINLVPCPLGGSGENEIPFRDESPFWKMSVSEGGIWAPTTCGRRYKVTMIVPYRDREEHLEMFLNYMHRFLQAQNIAYRIVLAEQSAGKPFNRGKLFNCAFRYVKSHWPSKCLLLHDVDFIPMDLRNVYACTKQPRHMWSRLDVTRFQLPYRRIFGGTVAISDAQFESLNGFSNSYWGWGGEDDEFMMRLEAKNMSFVRFDPRIAVYKMLRHKQAKPADHRWDFLTNFNDASVKIDGLTTVQCRVVNQTLHPLYTRLLLDL